MVLAFAVVLAMATFFVGDTGVYNDDYFLNQRDPATGQIESLVMNRPWHLWRPVTRVVLPALVTTLWNTPWALHLISVLLHAAVVGLGYGLLRRVGVSAGIAAAGAMVFMVHPVHFEAVLWIAIICTLMSVVLVLLIWHGYAWWLTRAHAVSPWTRAGVLMSMAIAAWASAAMNEQPPGVLAVMPLLAWMLGLAQGKTWTIRLWRSLAPVCAVGMAIVLYLAGFFRHKDTLNPSDVPESATQNLMQLAAKIPAELALTGFARGALLEGVSAAMTHPVLAAGGFGLLLLVAIIWVCRAFQEPNMSARSARRRWVGLIVLGVCWTLLAWLPVAAAHAVTSPRLHYVPLLGMVFAMCGTSMCVGGVLGRLSAAFRSVMLGMLRLTLCGAIGASVLMWIGVCEHLKRRYIADESERRSLAQAVGTGVEPGTMLVPVRINSVTTSTGSPRFDRYFHHCWFWQFSAGWSVRLALKRDDVYTFQTVAGLSQGGYIHEMLWLSDEDPLRWVLMRSALATPRPSGHWQDIPRSKLTRARLLPLDRCVFFEVVEPGRVEVFTVVRLHGTFGEPIDLFPRQTALMQRGRVPPVPGRRLDLFMMPEDVRRAFARNEPGPKS